MSGGTLEIVEHLYPERRWLSYQFKGKNLWGIVFDKYTDVVEHIMEISGSKIYYRYLMVDDFDTYKGSSVVSYRFYVDFRKPLEENANFWLKSKLSGWQDLKTKDSFLEIKFEPFLKVKFSYANVIQKSLIDMYWYVYYHKRVNKLKEESKNLFEKLLLELKVMLGVEVIDERLKEAWSEGV